MGKTQLPPDLFEKLLEFFRDSKRRSQARSATEQIVNNAQRYDTIAAEQFWFPIKWLQAGMPGFLAALERPAGSDIFDDSEGIDYEVYCDTVKEPLEKLVNERLTIDGARKLFEAERQQYIEGHPYGYVFRRNALAKEAEPAVRLVCLAIAHDMQQGIGDKVIPTSIWLPHTPIGRYLHLQVGEVDPNTLRGFLLKLKKRRLSGPEKIAMIIEARKKLGQEATQEDVAHATGIDRTDVNKLEKKIPADQRVISSGFMRADKNGASYRIEGITVCKLCGAVVERSFHCPLCDELIENQHETCHKTHFHSDDIS